MSLADHRPRQDGPTRGRPRSEAVERSITEGVLKLLEDGVPLAEAGLERLDGYWNEIRDADKAGEPPAGDQDGA